MLLSRILGDYETLREYEEAPLWKPPTDASRILTRLIAQERSENPKLSDSYYDGFSQMEFEDENLSTMCDLMVSLPRNWSEKMLIRHDNMTYVKADTFKDWMRLIGRIPPLWIIAAQRLDEFDQEEMQSPLEVRKMVQRMNLIQFEYSAQPVPYIPDLLYYVHQDRGLDDLHIHLNGSTETDAVWWYMLYHPHGAVTEYAKAYRRESVRKLSEQIMPGVTPQVLLKRLVDARELRNTILYIIAESMKLSVGRDRKSDLYASCILTNSHWSEQGVRKSLIEELLFYLLVMKFIDRESNNIVASMLYHYLLIKGMVHRFLVMQQSQVGFSQFQMISDDSFREGVEQKYEHRFKQLAGCANIPYLRVVEGRFSPRMTSFENRHYVGEIVSGFEKAKKSCPNLLANTELRLIAHFIKKPDKGQGIIKHHRLRNELKRKAWALAAFMKRDADGYGRYIHGIDAAASEFDARPEVFAAAYRYLREKGIKHFTFHAGEDFHHLISGLRTIYEAIEFLDLRSGDRLGHCTAVGIMPELWKERTGGVCYVPTGEWLDDLVFVWAMIRDSRNKDLQPAVLKIESEIASLSMRVYDNIRHPSVLWDAILLRRWCPLPELNEYCPNPMQSPEKRRALLRNELEGRIGFETWRDYHQVGENMMPDKRSELRKRYDKIMRVPIEELFSMKDLEELQRMMLDMMAKRNIVIEALPSSNLRISYYERLKEYHLKRWLDRENHECLMPSVVIGSDDPGIFMTNIYNEYAMIYQHLAEQGIASMERIDKIRSLQNYSKIYRF